MTPGVQSDGCQHRESSLTPPYQCMKQLGRSWKGITLVLSSGRSPWGPSSWGWIQRGWSYPGSAPGRWDWNGWVHLPIGWGLSLRDCFESWGWIFIRLWALVTSASKMLHSVFGIGQVLSHPGRYQGARHLPAQVGGHHEMHVASVSSGHNPWPSVLWCTPLCCVGCGRWLLPIEPS